MQQTEHLKLNLIETGDPISPAPLNENAERLEAALRTKADAALEQRVTVLEGKRLVLLVYTGDGTQNRVIPLGFTPTCVIYFEAFHGTIGFLTPEDNNEQLPAIVEGGVLVRNTLVNFQYNAAGREYRMILFN